MQQCAANHERNMIGNFAREPYLMGCYKHGNAGMRELAHDLKHLLHHFWIE